MTTETLLQFSAAWFTRAVGVLVPVTALIGLAWLVGLGLGRKPAARHGVWLTTLLLVLLSPVLVLVSHGRVIVPVPVSTAPPSAVRSQGPAQPDRPRTIRIPDIDGDQPRQASGTTADRGRGDAGTSASRVEAQPSAAAPPASGSGSGLGDSRWCLFALGAGGLIWCLGSFLRLASLVRGMQLVAELRRTAWSLTAWDTVLPLGDVASSLGATEAGLPPIRLVKDLDEPVTIGLFRPMVLIPEGLADGLSRAGLRDVLTHECAHALRRDGLVALLQRLVSLMFWPDPLVLVLNRSLSRAREEICDNHVLRGREPSDYATSLLHVAESCTTRRLTRSALAISMLGRWSLESRVAGLLDPRRDIATSASRATLAALSSLFLATAFGASAVSFGDPPAQAPTPAPTQPRPEPTISPKSRGSLDPAMSRIEGIVVDEDGKPAAGATVRARTYGRPRPDVVTGPSGEFALDLDSAMLRADVLAVSRDAERMAASRDITGSATYTAPTARVRLVLTPAQSLTVHVTDSRGVAVPGASVEVFDNYTSWFDALTDSTGDARFRVPAGANVLWVVARKSGVGYDYYEGYRSWPAFRALPLPSDIPLVLNGATTVKVKAVDGSGKPVAGIDFVPWYFRKKGKIDEANLSGSRTAPVTTDSQGIATFDFVPVDLVQSVSFLIRSEHHHLAQWPTLEPGQGVSDLTAKLQRNVPVSGRVLLPDGKPAAGILIQAEGRGNTHNYGRHHARTGVDGGYRLELYPDQSYIIAVLNDRWAATSRTGILVREGMTIGGLDFELGDGTRLVGRVTVGRDRMPAKGETVGLIQHGAPISQLVKDSPYRGESDTESLVQWALTDEDGRYKFRVGSGVYEQHFSGGKGELKIGVEPEVVGNFHIEREPRRPLSGTVLDQTRGDAPVADAFVVSHHFGPTAAGHRAFEAVADGQGRFQTERWSDPTLVYARSLDGTVAGFSVIGPEAPEVVVRCTRAARARGRVAFANGQPFAHGRVWCNVEPPERPKLSSIPGAVSPLIVSVGLSAQTDAQGRFEVAGLPIGANCLVSAQTTDGGNRSVEFRVDSEGPIACPDVIVLEPVK